MSTFGHRLAAIRKVRNLSQRALAEKSNVSPSAISSYEKYGKIPPLDVATRIAIALGVTVDYLSTGQMNLPMKGKIMEVAQFVYDNISGNQIPAEWDAQAKE